MNPGVTSRRLIPPGSATDGRSRAGRGGPNILGSLGSVRRLARGSRISSNAGAFTTVGRLRYFRRTATTSSGGPAPTNTVTAGQFNISSPALAGFRFNGHYGWIRMHVRDHDRDGSPDSLTAVDWAYESIPGAGILAGQTPLGVTAPEPGTLALAVLATGCAGLPALRRRRARQAARHEPLSGD